MRTLAACSTVAALLLVAHAAAAITPTSTRTSPLPVQHLALSGGAVAYVADAPRGLRCSRIGYWRPASGRAFSLDAREQCLELASTGQGVAAVAVAATRLLWLTYAGGNTREWSLWTATAARRSPRLLRFAAAPVEAPAPVVLGPGTAEGIPYAVGRQIVYLGDDGARIFTRTEASPVRALAAGVGGRVRVAALLADGSVVGLERSGEPISSTRLSEPVTAIRVAATGTAIQVGSSVSLGASAVPLPRGAVMVDVAQGRILWTRAGDLGETSILSGRSRRLVDGTASRPVLGQLETRGLVWARGRSLRWRAGLLPD